MVVWVNALDSIEGEKSTRALPIFELVELIELTESLENSLKLNILHTL